MEKARIILIGKDVKELENVSQQIVDITGKTGAAYSGPIPMPTKKLKNMLQKIPRRRRNRHLRTLGDENT